MWYGERSGGIRTYLDAKAAFARADRRVRAPPGRSRRASATVSDHTCSLPSIRVATSNGYRWPIGTRPLVDLLRELDPDVVLLHDPFWAPRAAVQRRSIGARSVMVHHGSLDLDASALPGPDPALPARARRVAAARLRARRRRHVRLRPARDTGRAATLPLRFGLDPAFYPAGDERRGDHVLYAGRIGARRASSTLLEAAARSAEPWPLWLMGTGSAEKRVDARVRSSASADRVRLVPHERDREALAPAYRSARCVVMPGELETFGLVAFEAAACGASTVACTTAPSARLLGDLVHTFAPGDPTRLLAAIERARAARARTASPRRASPPPTAGSARSPPSSPTSKPCRAEESRVTAVQHAPRPTRARSSPRLISGALAVSLHDVEPATSSAAR